MAAERRIEIWPWIVAGLLAAGIATSLAFYALARTYPDPEVGVDARRVGLEAPAATRAGSDG